MKAKTRDLVSPSVLLSLALLGAACALTALRGLA